MTEAELQGETEAILRKSGLMWHHCRDVRHCSGPRGFPDLFVAGRGGLLIPELKTEHGELSSGQRLWRWTLLASGQPWRLYRPADLESGLIHKEVAEIR